MTECGKLPTFPFYISNISELLARQSKPLVTLQQTRNTYKGLKSTAVLKPTLMLSGAVEISVYSHRQIPVCTAALQDQLRQQFGNRSVATNAKDSHSQSFHRKHHTAHTEKEASAGGYTSKISSYGLQIRKKKEKRKKNSSTKTKKKNPKRKEWSPEADMELSTHTLSPERERQEGNE